MPGSLPNTTILDSIDQVIAAINGLELSVATGEVTVTVETTGLIDKLEEIRTLYETKSLAQVVAQNTNFSDLIDAMTAQTAAIAALVLSCETIVNTTELHQTINGGGGGCSGETEMPPVISTDPEADPPVGWGPANPDIDNRRCKSCNHIVDKVAIVIGKLNAVNFSTMVSTLGVAVGIGVFMAAVSAGTGPIAFIIGVAGAVGTAFLLFTAGSLRMDFLNDMFQDMDIRKDLVCALYNGGNASQGLDDMIAVMHDNGANEAEKAAIKGILTLSGAVNLIDYSRGGSEVDLSGYVQIIDCDDCGGADWWNCLVGGVVSHSFTQIVISSVDAEGDQSANLSVPGVAESWNISLVSGTLNTPGGVPESVTRWSDLEGAGCGTSSGNPQWNEVLGTVQLGSYPSITAFALRSSTAFSIRIERI